MLVLKWKRPHYTRFCGEMYPPGSTVVDEKTAAALKEYPAFIEAVKVGAAELVPQKAVKAKKETQPSLLPPDEPKETVLSQPEMLEVIADMFDMPALKKIAAEDAVPAIREAAASRIKEILESQPPE